VLGFKVLFVEDKVGKVLDAYLVNIFHESFDG
jgi:hypothetical protein